MSSQSTRLRRSLIAAALAAMACGCAVGGGPPELDLEPVPPQVAFVGSELAVKLAARDPEGKALHWRFRSDVPDMCREGGCRGGVQALEDGQAVFKWVPRSDDVGSWTLEFQVTNGQAVQTQRTRVDVRTSIGYEGLPRFIQPLGTGTTLDLTRADCVEFDVVVDDPDSAEVEIVQEPPLIGGATLSQHDPFTATWRWCPAPEQLGQGGHRRLVLSASDGVNPKALKNYLVVLRRPAKPGCGGSPPLIVHSPRDWTSADDVRITAQVRDDMGVKHEPLLYYGTTRPSEPLDLSRMTQTSMIRVGGTNTDGTWEGRIPNPAWSLAGEGATSLYYVIAASDGGDGSGGCEQVAQEPARGTFEIRVSASASPEGGETRTCEPCSSDRACGATDGACVRMGTTGDSYCLSACSSDADCGAEHRCSEEAVESVDGARRRLCVPRAGTCAPEGDASCVDDAREDNDSREAAMGASPLAPDRHGDLVSCHPPAGDDEDWYPIRLEASSQVLVTLDGEDDTDLDLALVDAEGNPIELSEGLRSTEELTACLPAGDYFLRVYSFGEGRNRYALTWDHRTAACGSSDVCQPDAQEPDDDAERARRVSTSSPYSSEGNTICGGNDDWYRVDLRAGQNLVVDLRFIQSAYDEDLDIHFLDGSGRDLTPCTEADPSTCSAFQGQSLDSNEHYEHRVETNGTYYVVVRGFAGAQNTYDIQLRVE